MSKAELVRRYLFFLAGLFVNAMGIALITRANLGTSPISSNPYVLSLRFPAISLGMFTLFFSLLLIVLQLLILGKGFPKQFWLQIPVSFVLSAFIDLAMALLSFVNPQSYPLEMIALLIGCLVLGFGVFMEVAANVVMLPGECMVKSITIRWHTDFGKTKIAVDVTMVAAAATTPAPFTKPRRETFSRFLITRSLLYWPRPCRGPPRSRGPSRGSPSGPRGPRHTTSIIPYRRPPARAQPPSSG